MSQDNQKYNKDEIHSNQVTKTKISHGKIETAIRIRNAKTKEELDLEAKRLNLLNNINKTTIGENIILHPKLKNYQQLILIIGSLSLKSITEVLMACKKLKYSGSINRNSFRSIFFGDNKTLFKYSKEKGWILTPKGWDEYNRLKQFV